MKLRIFVSGMLVLLCVSAAHGALGPRHQQTNGQYSYQPPADWRLVDFPGLKYKIAAGPQDKSFSPNINVVDEPFEGSLRDYVDKNIEMLKQVFVNLAIHERKSFQANTGLPGEIVIVSDDQQKYRLRQRFYFLQGHENTKYVITCTSLAENGIKYDPICSESIATFRVEK